MLEPSDELRQVDWEGGQLIDTDRTLKEEEGQPRALDNRASTQTRRDTSINDNPAARMF
jgi:hypothetical protein